MVFATRSSGCQSLRRLAVLTALVACGGGGGAADGTVTPSATPTRLGAGVAPPAAAGADIELTVRLLASGADAPVLLQARVELPPQLELASSPLRPATALVALDGDVVDDAFVVLCGDERNPNAQPLLPGDLFRIALRPTAAATAGTFAVRLTGIHGATASGEAIDLEPEVLEVAVTLP